MEREHWLLITAKFVIAALAGFWLGLPVAVQTLVALQGLDILLGLILALSERRARSAPAWRGALKKAGALIVIALVHLIDPVINLQISPVVAVYYCLSETLSILENAGRLGVPLPPFLMERLEKLRDTNHR